MTPITVFLISVAALSVVCGIAVVIAKGLYLISKWLESKHFKPFTAYMLPILVALVLAGATTITLEYMVLRHVVREGIDRERRRA